MINIVETNLLCQGHDTGNRKPGIEQSRKKFKKMKKIFLYLLIFIPLISMGQDIKTFTNEHLIQLSTEIGTLHNEGLDGAYDFLKEKYGEKYSEKATKENKIKVVSELNEFIIAFVEKKLSVQDINIRENTNLSLLPLVFTTEYLESDMVSQIQASDEGKKISNELISAFNLLDQIMNNENLAFQRESYNDLLKTNLEKLSSEKEKVYLAAAIGIGYSSMNYWRDNILKWQSFFGQEVGSYSARGVKRNIAKADVSGIIVGGVGGCAYGAIGGTIVFPGVGTLTGCAALGSIGALTGGLGGSLTAAVDSFVDWLFG